MNYYAVQVQTGSEEKIIDNVKTTLAYRLEQQNFIFPKKHFHLKQYNLHQKENP